MLTLAHGVLYSKNHVIFFFSEVRICCSHLNFIDPPFLLVFILLYEFYDLVLTGCLIILVKLSVLETYLGTSTCELHE